MVVQPNFRYNICHKLRVVSWVIRAPFPTTSGHKLLEIDCNIDRDHEKCGSSTQTFLMLSWQLEKSSLESQPSKHGCELISYNRMKQWFVVKARNIIAKPRSKHTALRNRDFRIGPLSLDGLSMIFWLWLIVLVPFVCQ